MKLTHLQLEGIQQVLTVIGEKRHPMLAYTVTLLNEILRPYVTAIQNARVAASDYQIFTKKHLELCKKYAVKDSRGRPAQPEQTVDSLHGLVSTNYIIAEENREMYLNSLATLEREFEEALWAEGERQEKLVELLETTVDLEFQHNIKYSWCKELLSGNHMTRLLKCGILVIDEVPKEPDKSEGDTSEEVKK